MSREVRRVPLDWEHPHEWADRWDRLSGRAVCTYVFKPLFDNYAKHLADSIENPDDWEGEAPDPSLYMPDFSDVPEDRMGIAMYETVSEGTPISPTFRTAEALADWLARHNASAFAGQTATYEQWLSMIGQGWAPTAVSDGHGLRSGVEAFGERN